jgi:hypothetical protein
VGVHALQVARLAKRVSLVLSDLQPYVAPSATPALGTVLRVSAAGLWPHLLARTTCLQVHQDQFHLLVVCLLQEVETSLSMMLDTIRDMAAKGPLASFLEAGVAQALKCMCSCLGERPSC